MVVVVVVVVVAFDVDNTSSPFAIDINYYNKKTITYGTPCVLLGGCM